MNHLYLERLIPFSGLGGLDDLAEFLFNIETQRWVRLLLLLLLLFSHRRMTFVRPLNLQQIDLLRNVTRLPFGKFPFLSKFVAETAKKTDGFSTLLARRR